MVTEGKSNITKTQDNAPAEYGDERISTIIMSSPLNKAPAEIGFDKC